MQAEMKDKIHNWSEYKALIQRGSINIWIEENTLKKWYSSSHTCIAVFFNSLIPDSQASIINQARNPEHSFTASFVQNRRIVLSFTRANAMRSLISKKHFWLFCFLLSNFS